MTEAQRAKLVTEAAWLILRDGDAGNAGDAENLATSVVATGERGEFVTSGETAAGMQPMARLSRLTDDQVDAMGDRELDVMVARALRPGALVTPVQGSTLLPSSWDFLIVDEGPVPHYTRGESLTGELYRAAGTRFRYVETKFDGADHRVTVRPNRGHPCDASGDTLARALCRSIVKAAAKDAGYTKDA